MCHTEPSETMPRGRHKQHKGRAKHYLNPEEVREQEEKKKREDEWRRKKGMVGDQPEEEEEEEEESGSDDESGAMGGAIRTRPSPGDLPPSDEESSDEDLDSQLQRDKTKGVEGLIDVANPNRVVKKTKKAGDIDINARVELSRKEREEIERQRDASAYRRLHEAGRTEEARRDLARLAIIRQQREEAARKKEAERKAKETQATKERKKK